MKKQSILNRQFLRFVFQRFSLYPRRRDFRRKGIEKKSKFLSFYVFWDGDYESNPSLPHRFYQHVFVPWKNWLWQKFISRRLSFLKIFFVFLWKKIFSYAYTERPRKQSSGYIALFSFFLSDLSSWLCAKGEQVTTFLTIIGHIAF